MPFENGLSVCGFCKDAKKSREEYTSHIVRVNGKVTCPLLRQQICKLCGATGDFAHTPKFCPVNPNKRKPSPSPSNQSSFGSNRSHLKGQSRFNSNKYSKCNSPESMKSESAVSTVTTICTTDSANWEDETITDISRASTLPESWDNETIKSGNSLTTAHTENTLKNNTQPEIASSGLPMRSRAPTFDSSKVRSWLKLNNKHVPTSRSTSPKSLVGKDNKHNKQNVPIKQQVNGIERSENVADDDWGHPVVVKQEPPSPKVNMTNGIAEDSVDHGIIKGSSAPEKQDHTSKLLAEIYGLQMVDPWNSTADDLGLLTSVPCMDVKVDANLPSYEDAMDIKIKAEFVAFAENPPSSEGHIDENEEAELHENSSSSEETIEENAKVEESPSEIEKLFIEIMKDHGKYSIMKCEGKYLKVFYTIYVKYDHEFTRFETTIVGDDSRNLATAREKAFQTAVTVLQLKVSEKNAEEYNKYKNASNSPKSRNNGSVTVSRNARKSSIGETECGW